jgi:hypothetical protein
MPHAIKITFLDDDDQEIVVTATADTDITDLENQAEDIVDIIMSAARDHASKSIDYNSFASDSAYLEALDAAQESLTFIRLQTAADDAVQKRYAVEYAYNQDGTWMDSVTEGNAFDADLAARLQMCDNEGMEAPSCNREELTSFIDSAIDFNQLGFELEPMSFSDFRALAATAISQSPEAENARQRMQQVLNEFQ